MVPRVAEGVGLGAAVHWPRPEVGNLRRVGVRVVSVAEGVQGVPASAVGRVSCMVGVQMRRRMSICCF